MQYTAARAIDGRPPAFAHALKSTGDTVDACELKALCEKIEAYAHARRSCALAKPFAAAALASFEQLRPQPQTLIARERSNSSAGAPAPKFAVQRGQ